MANRRYVPPRHLSLLFVGITLALAVALVWLGLELVHQDRALEVQRVRDELQRVAESAAERLGARLLDVEETLERLTTAPETARDSVLIEWGKRIGNGALLVDLRDDSLRAEPTGVLRFEPGYAPAVANSPGAFSVGEAFEFRQGDTRSAMREYRRWLGGKDAAVRGGALLRVARVQQKVGDLEGALESYRQLAGVKTGFDGTPAGVLARHARMVLLETMNRRAEARMEAESLRVALHGGARRLTKSGYEYYAQEVRRRLGDGDGDAAAVATALSIAADSLYRAPARLPRGKDLVVIDSTAVLRVWRVTPAGPVAFLASADYVSRAWVLPLERDVDGDSVTVQLDNGFARGIAAGSRGPGQIQVTLGESETGLPWSINVSSNNPLQRSAAFATRRRILLTALVVSLLLVVVGTYAVARAVNRELAVARMQSDFVAAVSHEFRTPLTSLRQVTELLSGGRVSSDERRAQYHEVLRRETSRLHRLVENLLDFGRFEAGAHEFRFERLAPIEIVEPLINEFRDEVSGRGFEIALRGEATSAVSVDREAMTLALRNLLDNAVKYSGNARRIDVSVSQPNGRVAIIVKDQGMGITPGEERLIFDRFTRGQVVRASGIPGTGIGLAMVYHIVREHGGEVRVASTVSKGSTFTILLPPLDA